jgi:hypothetical protein
VPGFNHTETLFYAILFVVAALACLFRVWNDREISVTGLSLVGRCATSGIYGFGVCAVWLGRFPSDNSGGLSPYAYVAIAAFVGMAGRELQERIIGAVFRKIGLIKDQTN